MRRVEGGEVTVVVAAFESYYIAVDGHSGSSGGNGKGTYVVAIVPAGADGDVLRIAAAYDTYGSTGSGCLEVELYRRSVGNGKGDIAAHVYLCLQSGGTREKPYDEGE